MNIFLIISIVNLALVLVFFFYFRWYIKRRISALNMLEVYEREVNELINEVDAVTDRDLQLIEDRIKKLKDILETADKRINLYIEELEKSRSGEALYTSLGRGIRSALTTEESPPLQGIHPQDSIQLSNNIPAASEVSAMHTPTSSYDHLRVVKPLPPVELPPITPPSQEEPPPYRPPTKRQLRAQIDLLLNEGLPADEIALRLGISVAEVNLAMNLRRSKG